MSNLRRHRPALSLGQVEECRDLYASGWKADDLAARYGVGRRTVYRALSGYDHASTRIATLVRDVAPEVDPTMRAAIARELAEHLEVALRPFR